MGCNRKFFILTQKDGCDVLFSNDNIKSFLSVFITEESCKLSIDGI
jgi:hypothetical protein